MSIIEKVVDLCGGQTRTGKQVGVTQQAVRKWLTQEMPVSAKSAIKIERATNGAVTRQQLRPDIFGEI